MARSIVGAGGRPEVTAARSRNVIKIAISQAAFEAITETMPLGSVSVGHENESNERAKGSSGSTGRLLTGSGRCAGRARATAT